MSVIVDPAAVAEALARATLDSKPKGALPALANRVTEPKESTPARASRTTEPIRAAPARAIAGSLSNVETPARARSSAQPMDIPSARDGLLTTIRILGRTLDDLERLRIMNGNRVRAAKADGIDLPWMEAVEAHLEAAEHAAELELKRAWRKHPLAPWAKAIPGAGEVLMGRLIAEIGDPAERPNPAKLLAYCGHGDPARAGKIPKGATQEEMFRRGSPHAKKAVWKVAYQAMRTKGTPAQARAATDSIQAPPARVTPRSPYRDVYDARKEATAGKLHDRPCVRCGPAGKPALPGSEWSDAHRHADALRIVGKRFLIDLWVASRAIEQSDNHGETAWEAQ